MKSIILAIEGVEEFFDRVLQGGKNLNCNIKESARIISPDSSCKVIIHKFRVVWNRICTISALDICLRSNYMRFSFLLLILLLQVPARASGSAIDSLLNILPELEKEADNKELMDVHIQLGNLLSSRSEERYKAAIFHYDRCIKIALMESDFTQAAHAIFNSAASHKRANNFQKALKRFYRVVNFDKGPIDELMRAGAHTQISAIYQALGDYEKAFEQQMQGLLIFEIEEDSLGIANSYYNIGSIFFYQLQYEKALESYQKAKEICDALKNEAVIYSCLAAMGSVHAKLGLHEESLDYNRRSLELAEKLNYKTGIAYAKGNIASNFVTQKKYFKAEAYYREAIQLKTELNDIYSTIGSKIEIAQLYIEWKKAKKATPYLEEALKAAKSLNSKSRQSEIYKELAIVYDQLGKPLIAYEYNKQYVSMKDSLLNEKTLEEMGASKRRFDVQKSEHEIQLLKKGNELLEKNEEIRKQQIYLFAITTVALLLFFLSSRNKLNYQNKLNKLLEEKNLLLNSKNEEIQIKNKQLQHSNEDLQQFAYVASHDLKEPLRMIGSYTQLLKRRYAASFDESGNEFMHYIVDAVGRMENLLNDLLDFSIAGSQEAPQKFVSTSDVMLIVESNLRHSLEILKATLVVKSENLPLVKAHQTQLLQLLQNLVSNGMKFRGDRDPIVEIDAKVSEKGYVFSVKDNGIGISEENLEKVFEMFRRLHTREEYEGTGIGLATCKRIVATWGGDIWAESVKGQGSTFFFSVPKTAAQVPVALEMAGA